MLRLINLLLLLAVTAPTFAQFEESEQRDTWLTKLADLDTSRKIVDRVVVCFDEGSFLIELAKWDADHYWPILLWDSDLVPKFLREFEPQQILLSPPTGADANFERGIEAVSHAWGIDAEKPPTEPDQFLAALEERKRPPMGAVLLAEGSPELLGGLALAAARFQIPLSFTTKESQDKRIQVDQVHELRKELMANLEALEVAFNKPFDDLDFITVANHMPFGYTQTGEDVHPGGYTVDDMIARKEDKTRWGWVGRLVGGPVRSVYMAMGALFLQPKQGLFFSRYNPNNQAFGFYDPEAALDTFSEYFPTEVIRHPDATLARWRQHQWPRGNRAGFLYVNSSGGAKKWSTSKGQASYFDVPDTIPAIVHYTHSGSAAQPFNVDTIAGRWMANGAYVYFGSYAEPYLSSFVAPKVLAGRVALGIPLGAAMRHGYTESLGGQRKMKVKGQERVVSFNMSGPWKLAYFGDPRVRLTKKPPKRVEQEPDGSYLELDKFLSLKGKKRGALDRYAIASVGAPLLDLDAQKKVAERRWKKLLKVVPTADGQTQMLAEMVQVWIESLRDIDPVRRLTPKIAKPLTQPPKPIVGLVRAGAISPEAARLITEYAKSTIGDLLNREKKSDRTVGRFVLELVCCFPHPESCQKDVYAWVVAAAREIGVAPAEIQKAVLKRKWVPPWICKTVTEHVKKSKK